MTIRISDGRFRHLVQLANSAALDQRKWHWFLEDLHKMSGGIRVQLLRHDARARAPMGFLEFGYESAFVDSYNNHYGSRNPWMSRFSAARPGHVRPWDDALSLVELERTEFYSDWIKPQDDIVGGAAAVLDRSGDRLSLIGGNIPRRDRDRLEAPFVELLQRLVPFVQHSMQVSQLLGELTIENRVMREGMEPDLTAIFALDRSGRVHFANRRAETLLESGRVVRQDASARLRFTEEDAQAALGRALHDHFLPEMTVSLPFLVERRRHASLVCRTTPVSEEDGPLPWLAAGSSQSTGFVLLLLTSVAPNTRQVPHRPTVG